MGSSNMASPTLFGLLLMAVLSIGEASEFNGYGTNVYVWSIIVLVLAIFGLLMVLIIEVIIIYKISKLGGVPWRSIWLGQILLLGIFLSYLTCLAFVFKPTEVACGIMRFAVGFCYAIMLSVLFVKVLIILSPKTDAGFLKFGHQLMILLLLICVQIIINAQWLIQAPSSVENFDVEVTNSATGSSEVFVARRCAATRFSSLFYDFLASFIYLMLLRIVTLGLTLKSYQRTKKNEEKPNSEAKWILVTLCVTILIWIAWILIGSFISNGGMAAISIGLWATATTKLLIIFIPKLHKLATLKEGEYYYEDEFPGMKTYYTNGAIEMDPDPEHHSVMGPPSYEPDPQRIVLTDNRTPSFNEFSKIPEYHRPANGRMPPSVIMEERSNMSEIGPSASVIMGPQRPPLTKRDSFERVNFRPDPDALEMRHPGLRSGLPSERFETLSQVDDYGPPTQRYYTIGGHGRRAASVIGAPRYDRRIPAHGSPPLDAHYVEAMPVEPVYVHERRGTASVVGAPRYEPQRRVVRGYANNGYITHTERPIQYVQVAPRYATSMIGAPRYDPGPRYLQQVPAEVRMAQPQRTGSFTDLRVNNTPNGNIRYNAHTGSLPRHSAIISNQPNGRLVQLDGRARSMSSDDILERRSVY